MVDPSEQGSEAGSTWCAQGWLSRGMLQPLGGRASDVQGLSSYLLIPCHGVSQLTALCAVCY